MSTEDNKAILHRLNRTTRDWHSADKNPPALRAAPFLKGGISVPSFSKGGIRRISPAASQGWHTPKHEPRSLIIVITDSPH